jgi:uncharacterized protein
MEIMRLVVTGPVGAGKSTFIRSVSEIKVVDTDRKATDHTAELKKNTTVAFDFGRLTFGPEMILHIYGTPGQERFNFIWEMLIRKANAYILLVAANRPHEFRYARRIAAYMNQFSTLPMIVAITHADCPGAWSVENIAIALGYLDDTMRPPFVTVNPNKAGSVIQSLIVLVQHYMDTSNADKISA